MGNTDSARPTSLLTRHGGAWPYIAAFGIDDSYNFHGFLATIPEPATLSLLALGTLMPLRGRH